jgi:DNA modification methylase
MAEKVIIGNAELWHGDCREVLSLLPKCDLILTDPPYGIGEAAGKNKSRSKIATARDYGNDSWDDEPPPRWVKVKTLEARKSWAESSVALKDKRDPVGNGGVPRVLWECRIHGA